MIRKGIGVSKEYAVGRVLVVRPQEVLSFHTASNNPAVLRLIQMTIQSAHKAHIPCYMCGKLASDENAIPLLLQYGLDEFPASPGVLSETKLTESNRNINPALKMQRYRHEFIV